MATVSAVINGTKPVSDRLRKRVEEAIEALDYRPNLVARALHTKSTKSLALLVPSIANPFFSALVEAAEETAHDSGYSVLVGSTGGDRQKADSYLERMLTMGVDGLLIVLSWDIVSSPLVDVFRRRGIPVVGVAGARMVEDIDCLVSDDVGAGEQAARYLVGLGHRSIAFIGASESHTSNLRYQGVKRALDALGIPEDPRLVVNASGYADEDARLAMSQLLASGCQFSSVIAFNDVMAVGVLNALEDQGIRVPQHVSIVGFDDTFSQYARPRLTTVACPKETLGEQAVKRLLARIEGDGQPTAHKYLPTRLIVRESTRALSEANTNIALE